MRGIKEIIESWNIRKAFPYLVFWGVYIMFACIQRERFLTVANMKTIIQQSSVMAIAAVGLLFVIIQGEIDLSVSSIMGFAGFICADFAQINIPFAIAAGILTGTMIGMLNGLIFTYLRIPSMIVTVGMHMIITGVMRIYSDSQTVQFGLIMKSLGKFPRLLVILAITAAVSHFLLKYRAFGRYCAAIGTDKKLCRLNRIPVKKINVMAFVASGTFAAVAGIIKGCRIGFAVPTADIAYSFECITAVAIGGASLAGGIGTVPNTLIGAMTISMVSNGLMITGVTAELRDICTGIFLIISAYISLKYERGVISQ